MSATNVPDRTIPKVEEMELYDDLLQVAGLGLVNAVDRFDPSRGVPFAGFAKPTILGERKRHLRDKTEIAVRLGCSQMQVSRLLRRTLDRMREHAGAAMGDRDPSVVGCSSKG